MLGSLPFRQPARPPEKTRARARPTLCVMCKGLGVGRPSGEQAIRPRVLNAQLTRHVSRV